jgi:hypothetical protein
VSPEPGTQDPTIIDLDKDEAEIGMERPCPVCGSKTKFPSYSDMMRHWKQEHPSKAPAGGSSGLGAPSLRVPTYLDEVAKRPIEHENTATIEAWLQRESAHPAQAADLWRVLGLPSSRQGVSNLLRR